MVALIVVLVVAVVVVGSLAAYSTSKRNSSSAAPPAAPPVPASDAPLPMVGLESALAQVTDRSGRPIREAIDAETAHIDELRVPDDTGPLLRRALDHVSHHDAEAATAPSGAADGTADDASGDAPVDPADA